MDTFLQNHNIQLMGTTTRHSKLVAAFSGEMRPLVKSGTLECYVDTVSLVYNENYQLINANNISRQDEEILSRTLTKMKYIEPDILIFKDNVQVRNEQRTRIAGSPDLVIEIWSNDNDSLHRQKKFDIYSSSELTEHWYVEQHSDIIKCFRGNTQLPDQHMKNILTSQCGLEFDLRDMQTFDDTSWNNFVEFGYKG